ncbi:MAG: hypothetical protein Q7T82_03795 [Armatimonadota bacterium]|nr:hypothetical protein [Armatimonadota bacterium]
MENTPGFVVAMAQYRVQQAWQKPLLRKPFLKYGQCLVMANYFFQLGGVLGSKYRNKLDEFGWAFLGLRGEAGAMGRFCGEVAEGMLPRVTECLAIYDYVSGTQSEMLHFKGDRWELLLQHGMQKIKPETAMQMCWNYARDGSALGAIHPDHFRRLFEETNKKADEESWQSARAMGVDIPEQQDVITYDEVEQGESESFLDYLRQYAPHLYASLSDASVAE